MSVRAHLRATAGELIAYDLPPGPLWREIVETHAARGASFLPMDHRATAAERRAMLELARPTMVVDDEGETLFADGVPCDPERSWAVVATSGTGGEPKLAALPRTALARAVAGSLEALGIGGSDPWVCCLTPSHVGGLLVLLRGTLGGADVTVLERFEPGRLLDEAPGGAHVSLVPTMLRRLVDLRTDLSGLGVLLVGGGPVDPEVRDRAREQGGRVVETYGMTETCGGVVYDGHPFEGTEVWVDAGAVLVRGPILMDGYRNDPVATGAAFTSDGWLRTGDLGSIVDGALTVHGRADDAIRTGGETVWPQEVEGALRTHPSVADVAVAGRPDPMWGEHVVAWVVPADPATPPRLEELREHCRERLARFKAPRELELVEDLPRTGSGKVVRDALRHR